MRRVAGAVVLLWLAGCAERPVTVEGKVVWSDGSPAKELAGGLVQLQTDTGSPGPRGVIGPDGSFRLASDLGTDGAVPGQYTVYVVETRAVLREMDEGAELALPKMDPRFENPTTSGLTATIPPGGGTITVTVARAPTGKKR